MPETPRETLIVAAHPDDEVIGAASILLRCGGCDVVHVTDGAPRNLQDAHAAGCASREDYARARHAEVRAALAVAGIGPERCHEIGVADQEATFELVPLAQRLAGLLRARRAGLIITHPYEGGHPDHDAAALAVHAAAAILRREGREPPLLGEMTSYHAGPAGIETGTFLQRTDVTAVRLDVREREAKRAMLRCFSTQQQVLQYFGVELECFRAAPAYRFVDPPHSGRLFYEHFDWGVDGPAWRNRAADALAALGLDPVACL